jgi:hypothetical protein
MSDAQAPVQEHQFKELDKFGMYTDAPGAEGRRSRLVFSSFRGNPRITVFTGVPNDSGKGVINAPMNPETFLIFLNMLESTAKQTGEVKHKIACDTTVKTSDGETNQRTQQRMALSDIFFGKDAEGVVWVSVIAENRPKIKFEFTVSNFHRIYKGDGTQISKGEASSLQALATIDALRPIFIGHASELRPPYQPGMDGKSKPATGGYAKQGKVAETAASFDDLTF